MSNTDQAFIEAYRRGAAKRVAATATATAEAATAAMQTSDWQGTHGPHLNFTANRPTAGSGRKAPLSQVMRSPSFAVNQFDTGATATVEPVIEPAAGAMTTFAHFAWPAIVDQLARDHAEAFEDLLACVELQCPVLGLVGVSRGGGCTTTTLALARLLSGSGQPLAVIDAAPNHPALAENLGLIRTRTLADALATGTPLAEVTLDAVNDGVSLLVAGKPTQHVGILRNAIDELRQTNAAVLVDLGSDPRRLSLPVDGVVLTYPAGESNAVLDYSRRMIRQTGQTLVGMVETFAPAA